MTIKADLREAGRDFLDGLLGRSRDDMVNAVDRAALIIRVRHSGCGRRLRLSVDDGDGDVGQGWLRTPRGLLRARDLLVRSINVVLDVYRVSGSEEKLSDEGHEHIIEAGSQSRPEIPGDRQPIKGDDLHRPNNETEISVGNQGSVSPIQLFRSKDHEVVIHQTFRVREECTVPHNAAGNVGLSSLLKTNNLGGHVEVKSHSHSLGNHDEVDTSFDASETIRGGDVIQEECKDGRIKIKRSNTGGSVSSEEGSPEGVNRERANRDEEGDTRDEANEPATRGGEQS